MSIAFFTSFEIFLKERGIRDIAQHGRSGEGHRPSPALCAGERSMNGNITIDWTERRCVKAAWSALPAAILPTSAAGQAERGGATDDLD